MYIEELAFKDRKNLAQLNELDLLDIIEFLQNDRKQWINQFSKTHNESVEIQKENQELKKQVEEYKKSNMKLKNELFGKRKEYQDTYKDVRIEIKEYKSQQKEFIKYLEDSIILQEKINDKLLATGFEEILQKYKEIIGISNEKES